MSVLSTVAPWDSVAEGYSETTMKFFRGYVDEALNLVGVGNEDEIVDIACGPGTLALAAADRVATVKALDFSENMISMLRKGISEGDVTNIEPCLGDGQDLPYADESFDAAFSIFGLMFFPDRAKGFGETFRTLKPGGRVCVSSWAPVECSPLMINMFGALKAINPDMPAPKTDPESLENPDVLKTELRAAGFKSLEVHRVTKSLPVESAEEFWDKMVKGSAPVLMMKKDMPEKVWSEKSKIAIRELENALGSFPASLSSDAWLGIGRKPD